jgi:His-Xaa-Ser system protein HxsD
MPSQVAVDGGSAIIHLDRALYPMDAIYGASYAFIDRCFVRLDAPDVEHVAVILQMRDGTNEETLQTLAGEFGNELLTQIWRQRVLESNRPLVEALANRALGGVMGTAGFVDAAGLFDSDGFDDPLGIAIPWEEKYGQPAGAKPTSATGESDPSNSQVP